MPTIRVNSVDLHYETAGEGEPLLLIHGLGSSGRDWENQIEEMARFFRVITYDVRGHGRSAKPPGPYIVQQFARDAVDLLRALDAIPAHICGISMGGMIAFQIAVDFPDQVRSLVIVNSGPAMILKKLSQRALLGLRFVIVRCFGMRAMGKVVAKPLFPDAAQEHLRETFISRMAGNDPRAYLDSVRAINGWSVMDRIPQIHCPVLVLASDQDYTPVAMKREYASLMPRAAVVVLKDSRHAAPLDQPAEFNRVVLDFLHHAQADLPV